MGNLDQSQSIDPVQVPKASLANKKQGEVGSFSGGMGQDVDAPMQIEQANDEDEEMCEKCNSRFIVGRE